MIKAVLFDLGGTLIRTADIPEIFKRILEMYGVAASLDQISKVHKVNEDIDVVKGQIELGQEFWVQWNRKLLERIGIDDQDEFLARKIDELWWDYADLDVYPDVAETLSELRRKSVKVGIVTNGLKKDFQRILEELKLIDNFDVVVGIDSCNNGKPSKQIFLHALDKLQVNPEEAIFVGNEVKYDYEGAKKAGLKPLLIKREGRASENIDSIRSLTEVLSYV